MAAQRRFRPRNRLIADAVRAGEKPRDIAARLGMTTERVKQVFAQEERISGSVEKKEPQVTQPVPVSC
jgi:hypothetical protein